MNRYSTALLLAAACSAPASSLPTSAAEVDAECAPETTTTTVFVDGGTRIVYVTADAGPAETGSADVTVPEEDATPPDDAGAPDAESEGGSISWPDAAQDVAVPDAGPLDAAPDVITGASAPPRVFAYGNSLVYGALLPYPAVLTDRFPAQLSVALGPKWQSDLWMGRSGWTTSDLITAGPHDLAVPNAETNRTRKVLVFWEGVNEMGNPWQCEAYEHMTRARVAEGWKVILINALIAANTFHGVKPDGTQNSASWLKLFDDFNACVAANARSWGADDVVDLTIIPELQNPWDTRYYTAGGGHLTRDGYAAVVRETVPKVQALYISPTP